MIQAQTTNPTAIRTQRSVSSVTAVVNLITIVLFALALALYFTGQFVWSLAAGVLGLVITAIFLVLWADSAPGPLSKVPFLAVAIPVGLLLMFCLAMLVAALLLPSSVSTGAADTRVSTTIGAPGSTINGQFRLDPSGLQSCTQPTPDTGAVILAIDMSGSMQGGPERAAIQAAQSFITEVDLSVNRTGIVSFSDTATPVQPLTDDRDALINAVGGLSTSGGTSIAAALIEAQQQLDASPTVSGTKRTIILLSDGQDSNPQLPQTANSVKNAGITIITIGLGSSIDSNQLISIASSSGDYWNAPRPEDLAGIYQGIARNINSTVATNVIVTVNYSSERFDLNRTTISPGPSAVTDQSITWTRNAISDQPQEFNFHISPKGLGFLDLNDLAPQVDLVDCTGTPQHFDGIAGPTVLSAFPLIGLWLPLLLLSLINLILMIFMRGKGPRPVADPLARGQHVPADRIPPDYGWLDRLSTLSEETFPSQGNTRRVTLIGLGAFGRWTLEQIKRELTGKYGQLPDNVRLLYVEIQPIQEAATAATVPTTATPRFISRRDRARDGDKPDNLSSATSLDPEEIVLLQPEIKELVDKRDQELRESAWQNDSSYLRWWGGSRALKRGNVGRALGRLGVIYDMRNGFNASLLISKLGAVCRANPPGSRVMLLAALGETPSSALLDVATLVRYVTGQANLDLRSVEAFLTIPSNVTSNNDPAENAYAAALELQRFVQNRLYRFSYSARSDTGFNSSRTPVDHYYFMDESSGAKSENLQTTTWAAAADILTLIADSGLDGLQKERQLNPDRNIGRMWDKGHLAVSAMSVFIQRLPIEDLRRATEARLIYDALIGDEQSPALYAMHQDPQEGVQLLPPQGLATGQQRHDEVRQFLLGLGLQNKDRFLSEVLANALTRGWADTTTQLLALGRFKPQAVADKFSWALEEKAAQLLNAEAQGDIPSHSRGLGAWLVFLRELDVVLDSLHKNATQYLSAVSSDHKQDVLDVLTQAKALVVASRREVASWRKSLLEESDPSGYGDDKAPASLRTSLSSLKERAEGHLQTLRSFKHQKLALDANMLNNLYGQLWPAKRTQFMERVGWRTELSGGSISLKLLTALPTPATTSTTSIDEQDQEKPKLQIATYGQSDVVDGQVPMALLKIARAVSKELRDVGRLPLDISGVQNELLEYGDQRRWLKFDRIEAGGIESLVQDSYIAVPPGPNSGSNAETLANSIANIEKLELNSRPEGVYNTDAHQWAFVRETQLIALDTSDAYKGLERRYASGLDPDTYVFQAGKTAKEHESIVVDSARPSAAIRQPLGTGLRPADTNDLSRGPFTQQFVWTLDYRLRAITFARAYLYGLIEERSNSGGGPYTLRLSQDLPAGRTRFGEISLNGNTLLDAMQYFCMDGPTSVSPEDTNNPLRESNMPDTLKAIEAEIRHLQSDRKRSQERFDTRQKALQKELTDLKSRDEKSYRDRVNADLIRFILAVAQKSNSPGAGYDHLRQS